MCLYISSSVARYQCSVPIARALQAIASTALVRLALRRSAVTLDVEPTSALVVFKFAPRSTEGVAQCDIWIGVSGIARTRAPNCNLGIRQRDVDMELAKATVMLVTRLRLDNDVAARDVLAEPCETRGQRADASLESGRRVHLTEGDLQWKPHPILAGSGLLHDGKYHSARSSGGNCCLTCCSSPPVT